MTIPVATQTPEIHDPGKPQPVDRDQYRRTTCPLCLQPLQQRIRGLYCPRCKGWLDGTSLWQGGR